MNIAHIFMCISFTQKYVLTQTHIIRMVHITHLQRNVEKVYVVVLKSLSPIEQHWFISICKYKSRFWMLLKARKLFLSYIYHFINYYSIIYEHIQYMRGHMCDNSGTHLNNYYRLVACTQTITLKLRGGLGNDGPVPV